MNFENLLPALKISGMGMLGIFGVTTIIILCVYALNKILSGKNKDK